MPMAVSFAAHLVLKHATEKTRKTIKTYSSIDEIDFMDKEHLPIEFGGALAMQPILGMKFFKKIKTLSEFSL